MADMQLRAKDLYELIGELKAQQTKADTIVSSPYREGETSLWINQTAALIERALGSGDPSLKSFREILVTRLMSTGLAGSAERDRVNRLNRDKEIGAHLPSLDAAIEQAEKRLGRLAGAGAAAVPISGTTNRLPSVDFAFVQDALLRGIAERDYRELEAALYTGSVKSQAVTAGSVIEAVLFDQLLQKGEAVGNLETLTMGGLYKLARARGVVAGRGDAAAGAVRDARNFVHPGVERRAGTLFTTHDADLAIALMKIVLQELNALP